MGRAATVCVSVGALVGPTKPAPAIRASVGAEMFVKFPDVLVWKETAAVMANATRQYINARASKDGKETRVISQTALAHQTASIVDFVTPR